jgi:hypothetical protein
MISYISFLLLRAVCPVMFICLGGRQKTSQINNWAEITPGVWVWLWDPILNIIAIFLGETYQVMVFLSQAKTCLVLSEAK